MNMKSLLLCFVLALCLTLPVSAGGLEESFGVDSLAEALPESAGQALDQLEPADAELDSGLSRL